MPRILLIDDSPPDAQRLRRDFAAAGYTVDVAGSGDMGLAALRKHPPDLVVLDRPQADMEGVRLLQQLHDTAEQVPVLLVGHDPTPTDQVRWLDSGADDCVALTLSFEIVLARARALRRRRPSPPQHLTYADLVVDAAGHTVCRGQRPIVLTSLEFRLLYEFMLHAEQIFMMRGMHDGHSGHGDHSGHSAPDDDRTNRRPDE